MLLWSDPLAIITPFARLCSVETITVGDKKIGIRTSILEEKATACNMLCCYADELKEGFYPWIDQVGQGMTDTLVHPSSSFAFGLCCECLLDRRRMKISFDTEITV